MPIILRSILVIAVRIGNNTVDTVNLWIPKYWFLVTCPFYSAPLRVLVIPSTLRAMDRRLFCATRWCVEPNERNTITPKWHWEISDVNDQRTFTHYLATYLLERMLEHAMGTRTPADGLHERRWVSAGDLIRAQPYALVCERWRDAQRNIVTKNIFFALLSSSTSPTSSWKLLHPWMWLPNLHALQLCGMSCWSPPRHFLKLRFCWNNLSLSFHSVYDFALIMCAEQSSTILKD